MNVGRRADRTQVEPTVVQQFAMVIIDFCGQPIFLGLFDRLVGINIYQRDNLTPVFKFQIRLNVALRDSARPNDRNSQHGSSALRKKTGLDKFLALNDGIQTWVFVKDAYSPG